MTASNVIAVATTIETGEWKEKTEFHDDGTSRSNMEVGKVTMSSVLCGAKSILAAPEARLWLRTETD